MRLTRIIVASLVWAAVGLGALLASLYIHLHTDLADRVVREVALDELNRGIQGRVEVGVIGSFVPPGLELHDVTILDPQGRPVAHAERLSARVALRPLLAGTLRLDPVQWERGHVRLLVSEEGELSLVQAFAPVAPEVEEPPAEPGPTVELPHIAVEGVEVTTDVATVGLEAVTLRGGVWVRDQAVTVAVREGRSGVLWDDDAVGNLAVRSARIRTQPGAPSTAVLALESDGDLVALDAMAVMEPADPEVEGPQVEATLQLRPLSPATLRRFGQHDLADTLQTDLRGRIVVEGTPDHLTSLVRMDTAGGRLALDAEVIDLEALDATVTAADLDLAAIVADPPVHRVGGSVRARVRPLQEGPRRVVMEGEDLRADTYRVPSIHARAEVHEDHVRLERLDLPYLEGSVDVRGRIAFDGEADLHVVADLADLGQEPNLRGLAPSLRGGLRGSVDLRYRPAPEAFLETDLDLVFAQLRVETLRARRLAVVGRLSGPPDRPRVRTRVEGHGMDAGAARVQQATLQAVGGPDRLDLRLRARAAGDRTLGLDGDVRTTRDGYALRGRMLALGVAQRTWRGQFEQVRWVPGARLEVERFVLASGPQRVALDGVYRFDPTPWAEASLRVRHLDLAVLDALPELGDVPARGRVDLTARLVGPISHPATRLDAALTAGRIANVPVETTALQGRWVPADGTFHADVHARLGEGLGTLAATTRGRHAPKARDPLAALQEGTVTAELAFRDLDVTLAHRLTDDEGSPEVSGRLSGSAHLTGDLDRFSVGASLQGRRMATPGVDPLDLTLEVAYEDRAARIQMEAEDGQAPVASLEGAMEVDLPALVRAPSEAGERLRRAPFRVDAHVTERSVDRMPWALPALPMPAVASFTLSAHREAQAPVEATLDADVRWPGPVLGPADPAGTACVQDAPGRLTLRARLHDGRTRARVRGFLAQRRVLTAEASAPTPVDRWLDAGFPPTPPEAQLELTADVPDLRHVPVLCKHAEGSLTARASATDLFGAAPAARVTARSPDLSIMDTTPLPMRLEGEASAREASLAFHLGEAHMQRRARITARIPILWGAGHVMPALREDAPLQAALDLRRAPLGVFLALVPGIGRPSGTIDGRVRIEGPGDDMQFDGVLELQDASLSLLAAGNRFEGMSGRLRFEQQTVWLEQFQTRDDGGHITARGRLRMRGLRPASARLALSARDFPIRTAGRTMGTVTADVRGDMRFGREEGRARVRMDRMNIAVDRLDVPELQALDPHPDLVVEGPAAHRYELAPEEEPVEDAYVLVVDVETPTPFWVRRPDMAAQLEADLQVRVAETTTIHGRVDVLRGFFELVGRRFVLQRGSVQFTGAEEINPLVDLTATYDLGGGRLLTMSIMGDLQQPQLRFATDEREIPTLGEAMAILLGPRGADRTGQRQVEVQAASVLTGITAGILTTTLRRELGDLFPVITVDAGGPAGIGAVRAGIAADRIIPAFLEGFILSAYVEGFVTTADPVVGQADAAPGRGGVLVEFRHPYNLTSTVRVEPPQNWSLDFMWDP